MTLVCGAGVPAEEGFIEAPLSACRPEIQTYCSQVTPREGRLLACLYAHEDKLSPGCSHVLYRSATALEQAIAAFHSVATACEIDIANICTDTTPGTGGVLECLLGHPQCTRDECSRALDDVGLQPPWEDTSIER